MQLFVTKHDTVGHLVGSKTTAQVKLQAPNTLTLVMCSTIHDAGVGATKETDLFCICKNKKACQSRLGWCNHKVRHGLFSC